MKKTLLVTACLFCYVFSQAQVKVGADKSFKQSLNDYSTYGWSAKIDQIPTDKIFVGPGGVLVFNNETVRSKIKEAIAYELSIKGFKYDESNPDILVLYQVTEQPGTLRTYNGYEMFNSGFDSTRTKENVEQTNIKPGTLMINLVDAKSGMVAWQAYASGILKPDMLKNDKKIKRAVSDIFKHFDFKAKR